MLQFGGLRTTQIYYLTFLEAGIPNQGVGRFTLPLKPGGERSFLACSCSGHPRHSLAWVSMTPLSASVFTGCVSCAAS